MSSLPISAGYFRVLLKVPRDDKSLSGFNGFKRGTMDHGIEILQFVIEVLFASFWVGADGKGDMLLSCDLLIDARITSRELL